MKRETKEQLKKKAIEYWSMFAKPAKSLEQSKNVGVFWRYEKLTQKLNGNKIPTISGDIEKAIKEIREVYLEEEDFRTLIEKMEECDLRILVKKLEMLKEKTYNQVFNVNCDLIHIYKNLGKKPIGIIDPCSGYKVYR